jgi:hypothetical protein
MMVSKNSKNKTLHIVQTASCGAGNVVLVAFFENDQYDGLGTQQHCAAVDYRKNQPRREAENAVSITAITCNYIKKLLIADTAYRRSLFDKQRKNQ